MRNVTIWVNEAEWHELTTPICIRLFEYKGNKRTLNEFLSPNYIHRGSQLAPRDLNQPGECTSFDLDVKGQVVLMGYSGITAAEEGNGQPFMIFHSFERAVNWLVKNGYDFYGDESATRRCRKVVAVDLDAANQKYQAMAREYEKSLVKPVSVQGNVVVHDPAGSPRYVVNIVPACETKAPTPPTPPASRVLNDQGAPVKQKVKKPTFIDNIMKFLRLFKK
ncbi:hypothetical protein [Dickeya phage Ds16CZ]|uniref:Uncharacterized protein n=1 Tax=Dickeya phage Ds16CZ TaxID=2686431 RepID=A0A7L4YEX1_9CAUD|nr:hypothetical protein [Dickeya phage Ds16CZ]